MPFVRLVFAILIALAKLDDDSGASDGDPAAILETFGTKVPVYIQTLAASIVSSSCDVYVILFSYLSRPFIFFISISTDMIVVHI